MFDLLIQALGYLLLIMLVLRVLLFFEKRFLESKLREIDRIVSALSGEDAAEYLIRPDVLTVLRVWEIREKTPPLERYSQRLIVRKQINEVFASL